MRSCFRLSGAQAEIGLRLGQLFGSYCAEFSFPFVEELTQRVGAELPGRGLRQP